MGENVKMKLLMENWREYLNEQEASSFQLLPSGAPVLLQLTTPDSERPRDIVIVKHPDQTVKAYFKSSGVSGGGYKGQWIPFEGWATQERVPPGETFTSNPGFREGGSGQFNRPYGYYTLMAKTYWNDLDQGAQAPPGTIHAQANEWLQTLDDSPADQKPQIKQMTAPEDVRGDPTSNIEFFSKLNKNLDKYGAINRGAPVLTSNEKGQRLLFGLDEKS